MKTTTTLSPVPAGTLLAHSGLPQKARGANLHAGHTIRILCTTALSLGVVIALLRAPLYSTEAGFDIQIAEQEIVEMEEIAQTKQELPPPPPPKPQVFAVVSDDVVLEEEELVLDMTLDINEAPEFLPPPPPPPVEEEPEEVVEEPEIFMIVEEMPELIGGIGGLQAQITYPEIALRAGVEGRVIVQFVVDEQGRATDPVVVKGLGAGLDQEALRVVALAKFKPGKQRGRPVRVRMSMPITFRIE